MDNKKPKAAVQPIDAKISNQATVPSTDATAQALFNTRMAQNVCLVWLDNNIDSDNSYDCRNTITQLRRVINTIDIFTNGDECVEFIQTINNDKTCMIISHSLGPHVVPCVHGMSQVDSIFIFCCNKEYHEDWVKEWPKIKGVFTEITPICEALKEAASQCEQNTIAISFIATDSDMSKKKLDQLDCSFMYSQVLKEILLSITFEQQHIQEYTDYCCAVFAYNTDQLNKIKNFKSEYRNKTPVWWYTGKDFLYPMLNRVLRTIEVDIIIKMGFFISDLHRQIEQLHSEQFDEYHSSKSFTVYRGQGLSETDFQQMSKTKGGLMAFNNFLSTSKDYDVSLAFAESNQSNPDLVGILFVMTIDPSVSTTSLRIC